MYKGLSAALQCIFARADADTIYTNTGAKADLYLSNKTRGAMHFFDAASQPTWVVIDPSTGAQVYPGGAAALNIACGIYFDILCQLLSMSQH